jgi:acetyl-CoA carboxylase carboxyl transferase subunit beta
MAWFNKAEVKAKPSRQNLWVKCKKCGSHIFENEWVSNLNVCPNCNYHGSLPPNDRIKLLFDKDSFQELFTNIGPVDSLKFVDLKGSYKDKFEANKKKLGVSEAVVTGHGTINSIHVAVAIMDFRFLGGSLGSGTGEKILQAANFAYENNIPYIVFSESGGARMQEGVLSLMQMAKTCNGVARLNKKNIPFISVLANPTTGGVTASYAMMGDVNIAEPFAVIGFAGRRVIEQTIGEKLPDDFQTAEYLLAHGFIDSIVNRKDLKDYISNLLGFYNR